jgi:hypothetical protein
MKRLVVALVAVLTLLPAAPSSAAVVTDAGNCEVRLLARGDADPVATGTCPGVRPGAYVETRHADGSGSGCSFNFVFDGFTVDGERLPLGRYIGTAGHCVIDSGQKSWPDGEGPQALDSTGRHVGNYVFAALEGVRDFAVIKLLPGIEANPQMCHWGGPTGVLDGPVAAQTELKHFGQGLVFGDTIPARTALSTGGTDPDEARAYGAVIFGDSGSGIIAADGRALGVIVTVGYGMTAGGDGTVGITRLTPQLELAEGVLGIDLELVTAPRTN